MKTSIIIAMSMLFSLQAFAYGGGGGGSASHAKAFYQNVAAAPGSRVSLVSAGNRSAQPFKKDIVVKTQPAPWAVKKQS